MEKEFKRALILALALILAAGLAFAAAVAQTGAFTRLSLSFSAGGETTGLYVQPGETPDMDAVALPEGARVLCWLDEEGNVAEPSAPAERDAAYTALLGPELAESMTPWLERDENGFALPDEYISGGELAAGVRAMFASEPEVSALEAMETVSASELGRALEGLLAPSELPALEGEEPLTRLEAAELVYSLYMSALYGEAWGFDAVYRVAAPDLDPLREGASALAACLNGENVLRYTEGFHNIDGWLYYADDMGLFLMDGERGGFAFGPDGRYTSGSAELDELVAEALAPICEEYAEPEERLRAAYLYVRDNFAYLRRNYYETGDEGWQLNEAVTMLSTRRGNCYNYAAAFWALARGLGFDAEAVAGTVGWNNSPHGWVIMYDGGTRVIYDVELEMAYHYERGRTDTDLYEMYPAAAYSWNYVYGERYA